MESFLYANRRISSNVGLENKKCFTKPIFVMGMHSDIVSQLCQRKLLFGVTNVIYMIKKFTSEDLDDMIRISREAYSDFGEDLLDSPEKTVTFITWPVAHGYYVNEECVGSVFGYEEQDVFHIYSVEVLHMFHKQGIGRILLDFCLARARQLGFEKFKAYAVSDGGKRLMAKYGFVKIGEKVITSKCTADVVLLNE